MKRVFGKLYRAQSTKDGGGEGSRTNPALLSKIIHDRRGNILTLAIGAIALTATASAIAVKGLVGPVKTAQRVTQQNIVQAQQLATVKILTALSSPSNGGDCDGDTIIEPAEWRDPSGGQAVPAGGGLVPNNVGAAISDPWGTEYGYCVWNFGSADTGDEPACDNGGGENRLGAGGAEAPDGRVMAVISAGQDRVFQTSCAAYTGDPDDQVQPGGGDDVIYEVSYAEAGDGSGLWKLQSGTSDVAEIGIAAEGGQAAGVVKVEDLSAQYTGLSAQTGVGEFMALKTDNILSRTGAGSTISVRDPLAADAGVDINLIVSMGACTTEGNLAVNGSGDLVLCRGGAWTLVKDNLGDHTATEALDMGSFGITDTGSIAGATSITASGAISGGSLDVGTGSISGGSGTLGSLQMNGNINLNGNYISGDGNNQGIFVDAEGRVGINGTSPISGLSVINTDGGSDGWKDDIGMIAYGNGGGDFGSLIGFRARGTEASPEAVQANNWITMLTGSGYDGSSFSPGASIAVQAETDWSVEKSARLRFHTTSNGSSSEKMRITSDGDVGIGIINPSATLDVGGNAEINGLLDVTGSGESTVAGRLKVGTGAGGGSVGDIAGNRICDHQGDCMSIDSIVGDGSGGGTGALLPDCANGQILEYDTNNGWVCVAKPGGGGDNLGNHTAEQTLDLANNAIVNAAGVQIGTSLTCTSSEEGTIRYVSTSDPPWEYCDGGAWVNFKQPRCQDDDTGECYLAATRSNDDPEFAAANIKDGVNILGVTGTYTGGGGCTVPINCPNVGDVCSDGSIFAGFMLYGTSCESLYVTDNNQSTSSRWKTATGTDDISTDDYLDGKVNHANRGGALSDFPAFELCEDNTYHGKSDWYLPARAELNLLWLNQAAINANAAGNLTTGLYWSSSERNNNNAWRIDFEFGNHTSSNKDDNLTVRCVRRDSGGDGADTSYPIWITDNSYPVATIDPGDTLNTTVTATDDSGSVTYSKQSGADWITVNTSSGNLSGTTSTSGTHSITVQASDAAGNKAYRTFSVVVKAPCPGTIGCVMPDGSIFAGDGNLFITDQNQSNGIEWSNEDFLTGANSNTDGAFNQQLIVGNEILSQYPAFELCENLNRHGHQDWYLPSRNELRDVLWPNRAVIGGFTEDNYWSSTEANSSNARLARFSNGNMYSWAKNNNYDVRCVRRE